MDLSFIYAKTENLEMVRKVLSELEEISKEMNLILST